MSVNVKWISGKHFQGKGSASDVTVTMDASPDHGGEGKGPTPMEMLLIGMGGCSGIDVVDILKKSRQDITGLEINISGVRANDYPKVYTKIHLEFVITGTKVDTAAVERAIKLSHEKYCSAMAMLGKTAEITHEYKIVNS